MSYTEKTGFALTPEGCFEPKKKSNRFEGAEPGWEMPFPF